MRLEHPHPAFGHLFPGEQGKIVSMLHGLDRILRSLESAAHKCRIRLMCGGAA
jgi:hypothetical protein